MTRIAWRAVGVKTQELLEMKLEEQSLLKYFKVPQRKIGGLWKKFSKQEVKMSDNAMTINLQAPVFNGKEKQWIEFIVKF